MPASGHKQKVGPLADDCDALLRQCSLLDRPGLLADLLVRFIDQIPSFRIAVALSCHRVFGQDSHVMANCNAPGVPRAFRFRCPSCETQYDVVRAEAPSEHNRPQLCLSCGGPLHNRQGKFSLQFFRVRGGSKRVCGRKPKLI